MQRFYPTSLLSQYRSKMSISFLESALFFLLVVFLPTQFGKHFWPSFSIVAGLRIDYLSPTLYFTDILLGILFIIFLMRLFSQRRILELLKSLLKQKKQSIIYSTICIFLLLNIYYSSKPQAGLYGLLRLLEYLFFSYAVVSMVVRKKSLILYKGLAIAVIFQSFLAIGQFLHQGSLNGLFYYVGERTFTSGTPGIANASIDGALLLRPYGTMPHPNALGGFFLVSLLLLLNAYVQEKRKIIIIAILVSFPAFFLTLSRSAFLAGTVVSVVILYKLGSERKLTKRLLSRVSLLFWLPISLSFVSLHQILFPRILEFTFHGEDVQQRLSLTQAAFAMIKDNIFVGVGLKNFLIALPYYQSQLSGQIFIQPVHNIYLLIVSELGMFLSIFILFLFLTFLQRLKRNRVSSINIALIIAVLIIGLLDHYILTTQQGGLLLSLIMGYLYGNSTFTNRGGKNNRIKTVRTT